MFTNSAVSFPAKSLKIPSPQHIAKTLDAEKRKELALQTLSGNTPISHLAKEQSVSRKFLYQNAGRAEEAIDKAFQPSEKDDKVLFYLPITKSRLRQMAVVLVLVCHSSFRGVSEFMRDILDVSMSPSTVYNIVHAVIPTAQKINESQDLSGIKAAAPDEMFQGRMPILAGIDLDSLYCYLLRDAEHRDADTWAIHLLDCVKQGLHPDYTVADAGAGLRAGQKLVWDDVPCFGDNFHIIKEFTTVSNKLEKQAYKRLIEEQKIEAEMAKAKQKGQGNKFSRKLAQARIETAKAIRLADDARTLLGWLRHDILALAGPDAAIRTVLYEFVIASLKILEELDSWHIRPIRRSLENQQEQILAFSHPIDAGIEEIAQRFGLSICLVRETLKLYTMNPESPVYHRHVQSLYRQLQGVLYSIQDALDELFKNTHRSSSMVENLNGRLRNYFFLRRQVGTEYLDLLRFFLNHHPFLRSKHEERVGKSPVELLTGEKHPHWLELLGFKLFKRPVQAA